MTVIEVETGERRSEAVQSAVSWSAILAGAAAAMAVTLVLALLGSGLGLAVISPWSGSGASATTFAVSTIIWLVIMQWGASGLGGFVTGRLRTRWTGLESDEVFFRDTVHGFLAWCISTLLVAVLLSSAVGAVVSQGVQSATAIASGATQGAAQGAVQSAGDSSADPSGYFVDMMFRQAPGAPSPTGAQDDGTAIRGEVTRILIQDLAGGEFPAADKAYLAELVSNRTGIPQAEAETRVNDVLAQIDAAKTKAKEAADAARKAALTTSLLTVVSLLVGAFIAAVAAAYAGQLRDDESFVPHSRR
jgi:heme/copper-type cytochrome/quinol oxidase subunit 2